MRPQKNTKNTQTQLSVQIQLTTRVGVAIAEIKRGESDNVDDGRCNKEAAIFTQISINVQP